MKDYLKDLTTNEKVGQMLMVGMETNYITDRIKTLIQVYKIGGVILYRKNFNTYDDLINLVNSLKELNKGNKVPLFIAIDQEGGRVNRLPKDFLNLPSANKIASKKDKKLVVESADITSTVLKASGFNMNFAPVLDVKRFKDSHAIGDRAFGETPKDVIAYGIPFMKKMQENHVIPVVKHFPGHGATKTDSHFLLPIITKNIDDLEKEDMVTFKEAIKNEADAILVGHLLVRGVTGLYPASLSRKFVVSYLRKKYHFNGVIITDDLKMRAIRIIYGQIPAFKKAFMSGNDIVVFRYNKEVEEKAIEEILKMVKDGKINVGRINRSVVRILKLKEKYNIEDALVEKTVDVDEINRRIEDVRERVIK